MPRTIEFSQEQWEFLVDLILEITSSHSAVDPSMLAGFLVGVITGNGEGFPPLKID